MSSLVGFCNPLLDISAEVPLSFLEKYGLKSSNAILAGPEHLPLYDELVRDYQVSYIAGGAGQNTVRAAQWMLPGKGIKTSYIGCVGTDANAQKLREEATKDGVNVEYLEDPTTPTGSCAVLIVEKERSLVANLGAANLYKKSHYDSEKIQELIKSATHFYITGFFLTVSPETMVAVGEHAAEHDKIFTFNVSAPFLIDFFYEKMSAVLPYTDIVFGNNEEFAALGKKNGWGEDLRVIANKTSELPKVNTKRGRSVIITRGADTTLIYDPAVGEIVEVEVPLVPASEIVDVNGAGDSFVGGFLSRLLLGKSLVEAAKAGNYCAGVTIRGSGTDFSGKSSTWTD